MPRTEEISDAAVAVHRRLVSGMLDAERGLPAPCATLYPKVAPAAPPAAIPFSLSFASEKDRQVCAWQLCCIARNMPVERIHVSYVIVMRGSRLPASVIMPEHPTPEVIIDRLAMTFEFTPRATHCMATFASTRHLGFRAIERNMSRPRSALGDYLFPHQFVPNPYLQPHLAEQPLPDDVRRQIGDLMRAQCAQRMQELRAESVIRAADSQAPG